MSASFYVSSSCCIFAPRYLPALYVPVGHPPASSAGMDLEICLLGANAIIGVVTGAAVLLCSHSCSAAFWRAAVTSVMLQALAVAVVTG